MHKINIIGWENPGGLTKDLQLLTKTLITLGYSVHYTASGVHRHSGRWTNMLNRISDPSPHYDLNIMLGNMRPAYFWMAERTVFIPNQEWFSPKDTQYMDEVYAVFAKTHMAYILFLNMGYRTYYIGFTSVDRLLPNLPKQPRFLHMAGASQMKGTESMLEVWREHPQWPELVVYQSSTPTRLVDEPKNIARNIAYLDDTTLQNVQNTYLFHLCLSEAEGWGHYIVEAMSCKAIVFVCDAPPMNDMIKPERGFCVFADIGKFHNYTPRWQFNKTSLELQINTALEMRKDALDTISNNARNWFERNDKGFSKRLQVAIDQLQ